MHDGSGEGEQDKSERERKGRVFTASFTHHLPCLPPTATQHVRLGRGEATQGLEDVDGDFEEGGLRN